MQQGIFKLLNRVIVLSISLKHRLPIIDVLIIHNYKFNPIAGLLMHLSEAALCKPSSGSISIERIYSPPLPKKT